MNGEHAQDMKSQYNWVITNQSMADFYLNT
jgi:hypothetical protein